MVLQIIYVRFSRAERGKTEHEQKEVPLCRGQKSADCVSRVMLRIALIAVGQHKLAEHRVGHVGDGFRIKIAKIPVTRFAHDLFAA